MLKNYLNTSLRFLKRNRLFAWINIIGLSIALSVSFIIILFVINEFSYNHCHKNRKQVYRVLNYRNDFKVTMPSTPFVLASTLKKEFPQLIKTICERRVQGFKIKHKDNEINVDNVVSTNSEVFDIFTLPLINYSNTSKLLDNKYSICLSSNLAEKLFDNRDAIGKEIVVFINEKEIVLIVTAVYEDIPKNSTFIADCLINSFWSIEDIDNAFEIKNSDESWTQDFWTTWVLLAPNINVSQFEGQFRNLEIRHIGANPNRHYSLQNLSDVYLKSDHIINTGVRGDINNIRLFLTIAFLIVLVASINYIILSTAVSSGRAKEIGIRKTFGAGNNHVKYQFLIESILLAMIVLPIAFVLMVLGLPYVDELFQTHLYIIKSNIILYVLVYVAVTLLIGITSGIYTSIWLSRLKVISVLKTTILIGKKKHFFRSLLIVIQLVVLCCFVTCTLIIRSQYNYALKKNPGFHNQNILLISIDDYKGYSEFLNEIRANPNVIMAAGAMNKLPLMGSMAVMLPLFQNKAQKIKVEKINIDYDFLQTMGIAVIKGRDFSKDFGSDLEVSCILNETAVKQLGIPDPIGRQLGYYTIIGVVKDFNLHSFHTETPPLMITLTNEYIQQIAVHYASGSLKSLLPMFEKSLKKIYPEKTFSYSTIEELFKEMYSKEKSQGVVVSIFALFSLFIASFGLFGLTLFIARSRTKEIAIKKVVGSSDASIIFSFLRVNIFYVLIATVISVPITFVVMLKWLNNFTAKIEIKWWFFAFAFVIAALVIVLTIFIHSFRAAKRNPVEGLRYE